MLQSRSRHIHKAYGTAEQEQPYAVVLYSWCEITNLQYLNPISAGLCTPADPTMLIPACWETKGVGTSFLAGQALVGMVLLAPFAHVV